MIPSIYGARVRGSVTGTVTMTLYVKATAEIDESVSIKMTATMLRALAEKDPAVITGQDLRVVVQAVLHKLRDNVAFP